MSLKLTRGNNINLNKNKVFMIEWSNFGIGFKVYICTFLSSCTYMYMIVTGKESHLNFRLIVSLKTIFPSINYNTLKKLSGANNNAIPIYSVRVYQCIYKNFQLHRAVVRSDKHNQNANY